jgi:hypothetical protein
VFGFASHPQASLQSSRWPSTWEAYACGQRSPDALPAGEMIQRLLVTVKSGRYVVF